MTPQELIQQAEARRAQRPQGASMSAADLLAQAEAKRNNRMSWGEAFSSGKENFGTNVKEMGEGIVEGVKFAAQNPGTVAANLGNLALDVPQAGMNYAFDTDYETAALDTVIDEIDAKYGSEEAWKKSIAERPAETLADTLGLLTGGAGVAAKVGAKAVGAATKVGAAAARGPGATVAGTFTGIEPKAIAHTGAAARKGNTADILSTLNEKVPPDQIVNTTNQALDSVRNTAITRHASAIKASSGKPLNMDKIYDTALTALDKEGAFKGAPLDTNLANQRNII